MQAGLTGDASDRRAIGEGGNRSKASMLGAIGRVQLKLSMTDGEEEGGGAQEGVEHVPVVFTVFGLSRWPRRCPYFGAAIGTGEEGRLAGPASCSRPRRTAIKPTPST